MHRHLANALGATALGALLLQPVITMAAPPAHARNEKSAKYHGYSYQEQRDGKDWHDCDDDRHDRDYDRYGSDDPRGWYSDRYPPRRGYVVYRLPPKHRVVHHHGYRYYYGNGAWYRPYGSRFMVVDPPVGLVISFLPQFSTAVYFGDIPYYRAGPVYYVWHPRARGYLVTDRPYRNW
jgi:hypothetical protein